MFTYCKPDYHSLTVFFVETWYDRSIRGWTSVLKNANLEQIGECVHSFTKQDAEKNHNDLITGLAPGMPYIIEHLRK